MELTQGGDEELPLAGAPRLAARAEVVDSSLVKGGWLALIFIINALITLINVKEFIFSEILLISPFLPWFDSLKRSIKSYIKNNH